jgi:hypothetical protein
MTLKPGPVDGIVFSCDLIASDGLFTNTLQMLGGLFKLDSQRFDSRHEPPDVLEQPKNPAMVHPHRFEHAIAIQKPAVEDRDSGFGLRDKPPVNVCVIARLH